MKHKLEDLYWRDFNTVASMAEFLDATEVEVKAMLKAAAVPLRTSDKHNHRERMEIKDKCYWVIQDEDGDVCLEHENIAQDLGWDVPKGYEVKHKDGNTLNNHPLNLIVAPDKVKLEAKPGWFAKHINFAHDIAELSSCQRLKVGCVITNYELDQVYAFGLNGNAKKFANDCDGIKEGQCGCVHAEANSLIKLGVRDPNKVIFLTHSPCRACAKLIINSGASHVYYAKSYRDPIPLSMLHYANIKTCKYAKTN